MLDLESVAAKTAMEALKAIGLKVRAPVAPAAFADPVRREPWIAGKGVTVSSLYSQTNPLPNLDMFVRHPIPFEELWSRSKEIDLSGATVRAVPDETDWHCGLPRRPERGDRDARRL